MKSPKQPKAPAYEKELALISAAQQNEAMALENAFLGRYLKDAKEDRGGAIRARVSADLAKTRTRGNNPLQTMRQNIDAGTGARAALAKASTVSAQDRAERMLGAVKTGRGMGSDAAQSAANLSRTASQASIEAMQNKFDKQQGNLAALGTLAGGAYAKFKSNGVYDPGPNVDKPPAIGQLPDHIRFYGGKG